MNKERIVGATTTLSEASDGASNGLENEIICEDNHFRFNAYKNQLSIIDKQHEFRKQRYLIYTMEEIESIIEQVIQNMIDEIGNKPKSIFINLWEDGDFKVTCRHGENDKIHNFNYHKFTNKFEYKIDDFQHDAITYDEFGNQFYTPNIIEEVDEIN